MRVEPGRRLPERAIDVVVQDHVANTLTREDMGRERIGTPASEQPDRIGPSPSTERTKVDIRKSRLAIDPLIPVVLLNELYGRLTVQRDRVRGDDPAWRTRKPCDPVRASVCTERRNVAGQELDECHEDKSRRRQVPRERATASRESGQGKRRERGDGQAAVDLNQQDYWYQRFDRQPRFAFYDLGALGARTRASSIRLLARRVADPLAPHVLASEGVRYVVLHDDVYRALGEATPRLDPHEYSLLKRFPNVRIYSVDASPANLDAALKAHRREIDRLEGVTVPVKH